MMDAWVVDQKSKGSWSDIGYEAPSSKNISYVETNDWTATAQFDVPDGCTAWNVTTTVNSTTGKATYKANGGCNTLTPNFSNIGAGSKSGS